MSGSGKELTELAASECVGCKGGVDPLGEEAIEKLKRQLSGVWEVVEGHHLEAEFSFRNFAEGLAFVNAVGGLAEREGHHPDIYLSWGKVVVKIWTHKIGGLHRNDFILAAKIDCLERSAGK